MGRITTLLFLLLLAACASSSSPATMTAPLRDTVIVKDSSPLRQAVAIESVSGGSSNLPFLPPKVSNQDLADALSQALAAHAILATGAPRYWIKAELLDLKQPFMAVNELTVTSTIKYTVTDATSGEIVLEDTISKGYTATKKDAYFGNARMSLANKGAIQQNAAAFIVKLIEKSGN